MGKVRISKITWWFSFLFIICITPADAQHKSFRIYTADDGLISNILERIFQDSDGFMWFGSNDGLSIYDGYRFTNYTLENKGLSEDAINSFFANSKDETWVIHDTGIDVFLKRKFVRTLPLKQINTIIRTSEGKLIGAGTKGIYEILGDKLVKVFSSDKNFYNIYEVGNYYIVDETKWGSTFLFNKSYHLLNISTERGILEKDKYGKYWVHGGLKLFLIDTSAFSNGILKLLSPPEDLRPFVKDRVTYIFTDSDGSCWFSLYEKGIVRIDKGGNIKKFDASNGLNSNHTAFFFEDSEGNMWVAGVGVIKFSSKELQIFSSADGLSSDYISSISCTPQAVWFAQVNGISGLYENKIYNFPYSDGSQCTWTSILLNGDSLWVGNVGLWLYKIHYNPKLSLELIRHWPTLYVNHFQLYKDGSVFISNINGLIRITRILQLQKLHDGSHFYKFLMDEDEIVSGGKDDEGISKWKIVPGKETLKLELIKQFDPLSCNHVHEVRKDRKGNFWFGTAHDGIVKFEKTNNDSFFIKNFKEQSGLNANNVGKIFISTKDILYAATNHGLFASDIKNDSLHFEDLNRKYEFIADVYDMTENSSGDLLLATSTGAILIRNDLKHKSLPPKVFFTQVLHNNQSDSTLNFSADVRTFSHTENNFSFDFVSTTFRNEEQVLFSYVLKKDNKEVLRSEPRKTHSLYFPDLSPGHYTLDVKALSADNIWSEVPARYRFTINSPFWDTWWFRTLIFLSFAVIAAGIFWFRLHEMKKLLILRTKISRDLHDEVGSTLSGIGLFGAVAKKQLDDEQNNSAKTSLDRIISNSDEMLGKMNDIVWAINPQNDSFEKVIMRLKTFAVTTSGSKNIQIHFSAEKDLQRSDLDMQRRKNIYLICKEAINNSIKYADCKNLYFILNQYDHRIHISIKDDGKGFDTRLPAVGNGLNNIKARAQEIKAEINISSAKDKGTSIDLFLKIT